MQSQNRQQRVVLEPDRLAELLSLREMEERLVSQLTRVLERKAEIWGTIRRESEDLPTAFALVKRRAKKHGHQKS